MEIVSELREILEKFTDIDEIDFDQLSPLVMEYHVESYKEKKPDELKYFSERFILIQTKLGIATQYVPALMKYLESHLKQFREEFQPFNYAYK
jgi:hypothetical protein